MGFARRLIERARAAIAAEVAWWRDLHALIQQAGRGEEPELGCRSNDEIDRMP